MQVNGETHTHTLARKKKTPQLADLLEFCDAVIASTMRSQKLFFFPLRAVSFIAGCGKSKKKKSKAAC